MILIAIRSNVAPAGDSRHSKLIGCQDNLGTEITYCKWIPVPVSKIIPFTWLVTGKRRTVVIRMFVAFVCHSNGYC